MRFGAWQIDEGGRPRRLPDDQSHLEKNLEAWIEQDPTMLGEEVRWVSRQLVLPDGSRLDLLGLTPDGTWVIAELKAGSVDASTVRQALRYFLEIAVVPNAELVRRIRSQGLSDSSVSAELDDFAAEAESIERDYMLLVAGVGDGDSAQRAAEVLARHGFDVPVRVVRFALMADQDGRRILVREVEDDAGATNQLDVDEPMAHLMARAHDHGDRDGFERIYNDLIKRGFLPRRKTTGVNFGTGGRKNCFWVRTDPGVVHVGYLSSNFPDQFGIAADAAEAALGDAWLTLAPESAHHRILEWLEAIDDLRAEQSGVTVP